MSKLDTGKHTHTRTHAHTHTRTHAHTHTRTETHQHRHVAPHTNTITVCTRLKGHAKTSGYFFFQLKAEAPNGVLLYFVCMLVAQSN